MAKILVNNRMLELMPDFIEQVERLVGKVIIVDSLVSDVKELIFESEKFEDNEIVLATVQKYSNKKMRVVYICSTHLHFRHTHFNTNV